MKKIMVVDDNKDLRDIIKRILDREGFETILAEDGDDFLEKVRTLPSKPDLILLDIMMPGTPVKEVIEKVEDIKIAFISAVGISDKDKQELSLKNNVVDFIQKPFYADDLIKTVKNLVGE